MNRRQNRYRFFTGKTDMSPDLLPGVSIVEICEQSRVLIENHRGIIAYDRCEVRVKVRFGQICVCGKDLIVKQMSVCKLVITGTVCAVHLQGRG